jgi:hypothetical protein
MENEVGNVDDPVFLVFLLQGFWLKEAPEPFLEQRVDEEQYGENIGMVNGLTKMDSMRECDFSDFKEDNAVDCDE